MFGWLWKKRKTNRTQSLVFGDDDEVLMCVPSDTAAWLVAKRNEAVAVIDSLKADLELSAKTVRSAKDALRRIREISRPTTQACPSCKSARKIFDIAVGEVGMT